MSRVVTLENVEHGTLESHSQWEPRGGTGVYRRRLLFWRNFTRRSQKCDLLVFLDGQHFFEEATDTPELHWSAVRRLSEWPSPLLVLAVPASKRRYPEYIGWSEAPGHFSESGYKHARFLVKSVLPYAKRRFPGSRIRGLVGASAGGVAALYTAWEFPGVLPAVACLSAGRHYFQELLEIFEGPPCDRVYLSCANRGMDSEFRDQNGHFARELRKRGCQVKLRKHQGDHSERTWGRRLPDLLRFFLEP